MTRAELLVTGVLAVSLSANVYVGAALKKGAFDYRPPAGARAGTLAEGTKLPRLSGIGLGGEPVAVEFDSTGRDSLVYVLQPMCEWCHRNEANIAALVRHTAQKLNIVVVSLTPNGLKEYMDKVLPTWGPTPVTILTSVPEEMRRQYGIGSSPQTFLISREGVVLKVWLGAYVGDDVPSIEQHFSIRLPGLLAAKQASPTLCKDSLGRTFGRGFILDMNGKRMRCDVDGKWKESAPVTITPGGSNEK